MIYHLYCKIYFHYSTKYLQKVSKKKLKKQNKIKKAAQAHSLSRNL